MPTVDIIVTGYIITIDLNIISKFSKLFAAMLEREKPEEPIQMPGTTSTWTWIINYCKQAIPLRTDTDRCDVICTLDHIQFDFKLMKGLISHMIKESKISNEKWDKLPQLYHSLIVPDKLDTIWRNGGLTASTIEIKFTLNPLVIEIMEQLNLNICFNHSGHISMSSTEAKRHE